MDRFHSKLVSFAWTNTLAWASKDTSLLQSPYFTNPSCFYGTGPRIDSRGLYYKTFYSP